MPEPIQPKAETNYESFLRASNLCVVGNVNRDLKTAPIVSGDRLLRDGETSVSFIRETIGGGGANSACMAAALGARVGFLGKVGDDELGRRLEQCLHRQGIRPHLARDPAVVTGTSLGLIHECGQRHFVSCLPNTEALRFEDLSLDTLDGFTHLYRADIWFSKPMLFGGNERLFQTAHERGLVTSIDLNWDPRWGIAGAEEIRARKEAIRAVLPLVEMAHGNRRELMEFADAPDLTTALHRLEQWGVKSTVVHLGSEGAGFYTRGKLTVEPSVPAKKHVNTTGTGDLLSVCFMLLNRVPDIPAKLRFANQIVSQFIEGQREFVPLL